MSTPSSVVVPPKGGSADAMAVTKLAGGGIAATALPLSGGRKTRRLSKKAIKMLKAMPKAKLLKLAGKKGGMAEMGGAKKKGSRKTKRRSGLLY
jgi:hypothetical protein